MVETLTKLSRTVAPESDGLSCATPKARFAVMLEIPRGEIPAEHRLKMFLKRALRSGGMKCIDCRDVSAISSVACLTDVMGDRDD